MGSPRIPGFIDLQVNGTHGIDFSADGLTTDTCLRAFDLIRDSGTAVFTPTIITAPGDRLIRNLETVAAAAAACDDPRAVAGVHLEGPFLDPTPGAIGAHNPEWVVAPDLALFGRLWDAARGTIRILTVSAGVHGVEELIAGAAAKGVVVSLGHQMAGYEAVRRAADAGATLLTHLGNGLPHDVNRHENPLLAGLTEERLMATLITDGHHLPADLVRLILRVKGVQRTIVVSDAAPVAGLPPGRHDTFGSEVEVTADGLVVNPETRYLAGSGKTMRECMNWLAGLGDLSYDDLVTMGVLNPARVLGIDPLQMSGPTLRYDETARRFVSG